MKQIVRNFIIVLKRFKTSSILNIVGLSIAYAIFFVIIVQTYYDFSFDRNFEKNGSIYKYSEITDVPTAKECGERFPEIKSYCYMRYGGAVTAFDVRDSNDAIQVFEVPVRRSSEGLIDVFTPQIIVGDAARTAFNRDGNAMLTESTAKKMFGNENPVGKVFYFQNQHDPITVVAVCEDFPQNCSLGNGVYLTQHDDSPGNRSYDLYLEISSRDKDKVLKSINNYISEKEEREVSADLIPLPDIHLKGILNTSLSLLAVGLLLLFVAYINFVNFSMAMAPIKLKGLNIRRIFGENLFFLRFSVAMEAAFLSFVAFLISIVFISYFNTGVVKDFFQADLSLSKNINLFLLTSGISLVIGFLAGIYPAFYVTSFQSAIALSRSFSVSSGKKLRNMLITFQFIVVIFFVVTAAFIKLQHDYMQRESWKDIKQENIIYFQSRKIQNLKPFENELRKNPDILDVTYSFNMLGEGMMMWGCDLEDTRIPQVYIWPVSPNYFRFFGIDIFDGNDFTENRSETEMIFNQTFVNKYGLTNIIGKKVSGFGDEAESMGVAKDFNTQSLHEPIKPIAFITGEKYSHWMNLAYIKISGQNIRKTIDYFSDTWKNFSNEPVDITFLNETLDNIYKKENNLAKLISICGLITVIVAVMGVYGLILFNVKLKRKTIALCKINGASVREVILMLNRGFIIQFVVAYAIAVPLAYIVVRRWLENFAYKTPVYLWVFIVGGLLVFLITALTVSYQSYKAATANPVEGIKTE